MKTLALINHWTPQEHFFLINDNFSKLSPRLNDSLTKRVLILLRPDTLRRAESSSQQRLSGQRWKRSVGDENHDDWTQLQVARACSGRSCVPVRGAAHVRQSTLLLSPRSPVPLPLSICPSEVPLLLSRPRGPPVCRVYKVRVFLGRCIHAFPFSRPTLCLALPLPVSSPILVHRLPFSTARTKGN